MGLDDEMIPQQTDRILDAINDLQVKMDKFKEDFHKSLEQGRTEAAQNTATKDAQALINKDLGEAVHGDGTKGLEEKARDLARSIEQLEAAMLTVATRAKKQTTTWNRLIWIGVSILVTLITGTIILALSLATQ